MHRWETTAAITRSRIIAIIRAASAEEARRDADLLLDAGVTAIEVSLTTPGALEVVADLAARVPDGVVVGAGTVLDEASARLAVLAGARFVVCPVVSPDVLRTAHRYGAATVPGAGSATEALQALELGADLVKLFPASAFGPGAVRDLVQALPQVPLVPTGGVTLDDAPDYIAAGAVALGLGRSLTRGAPGEAAARVRDLSARLAAAAR